VAYSSSSAHRPPSQVEDAPPPPYSKFASEGEVRYTPASTLNASTGGYASAGPSRPPTTFARNGKSSYRSVEDKKKVEVSSWETKFRAQLATVNSEVQQLAEFREKIRGVLSFDQQNPWDIEEDHVTKVEKAEDSLKDTVRTARRQGCPLATLETILDEVEAIQDTREMVKQEWRKTRPVVFPFSISELYLK